MVDVFPGLSGFKGLLDAAKAIKDINNAVVRNEASIGLQQQIIAAQEAYATLLQEKRDLETKVASFENWETEKKRYQAQQFEPGITVYVLKEDMAAGEPIHHACPQCYANRKARILQATGFTSGMRENRICNECKSEFAYGPKKGQPPSSRGSGGSWMSA
jgi:hypothetical protein